jgi:hypothetical protein
MVRLAAAFASCVLALSLSPAAARAQPAAAPPIFAQYRADGSHSGSVAAPGPGASAAPNATRSFVGGGGGIA